MIDFEEARQIVQRTLRGSWRPDQGTLVTLPTGFEDATHWRVIAGARESLVEGNDDFTTLDMPAMLVAKHGGAVTRLIVTASLDRLSRMTPVT